MIRNGFFKAAIVMAALSVASLAHAQTGPTSNWIVEFGIGWDNSISGNINSSAIGSLEQSDRRHPEEQVRGRVRHRSEPAIRRWVHAQRATEARVTFTFQSLDADLATLGDYGASPLYGQYSDYQSFALDVGLRRYGRFEQQPPPVRGRLDRPRIRRQDRCRTGGAPSQSQEGRHRFLRSDDRVHPRRQCGRALECVPTDRRVRPDRASLRDRDVRGRQSRGHRSRVDQRQQRALDHAVPRGRSPGLLIRQLSSDRLKAAPNTTSSSRLGPGSNCSIWCRAFSFATGGPSVPPHSSSQI